MASDATPVIELQGLEVRFGRRTILDNLNGSLSGRAIGLLGPNGAGKSTLINTLMGFYPPFRGTARIFGRDIRTDLRRVRNLIGYMPENESFIAGMRWLPAPCARDCRAARPRQRDRSRYRCRRRFG